MKTDAATTSTPPRLYRVARFAAAVLCLGLAGTAWFGYRSGPWWVLLLSVSLIPVVAACAVFLRPPRRQKRARVNR